MPHCVTASAALSGQRFIENTSHYDIERAHLEVDGTTVRLFVDVPLSIWKAFGG